MVATLIRLKLAVLRNSRTDQRAAMDLAGAVSGLAGVLSLWWLVLAPGPQPAADRQLLILGLTLVLVGWAVAPVLAGEPVLQARQFRLLALRRTTLTVGLLVSTLVGMPGLLTVLAWGSLVPLAGAALLPLAVALLAGIASVLLAALVGRVFGSALSRLSAGRVGAAMTGALTGALLVLTQAGWMVLVVIDDVRATGFDGAVGRVVDASPAGWAVHAVHAAAAGHDATAAGWVLALLALDAALAVTALRITSVPSADRVTVRGSATAPTYRSWPSPAMAAVIARETRAWRRDPSRIQAVAAASTFALLTCALPLLVDSRSLLPWTGCAAVVFLAATTANPHGQDGTGLWLSMQMPDGVVADVWGRHLTWTMWACAVGVPLTLLGWWWAGGDATPWALIGLVLAVGGGAGTVSWLGVVALAPGPDPRDVRDRPLDHADVTGQAFLAMALVLAALAPLLAARWDAVNGQPTRAVLVALLMAWALAWWWGGAAAAAQTMTRTAAERLLAMRSGSTRTPRAPMQERSSWRQHASMSCVVAALVALVPQALIPAILTARGDDHVRVWFLAMHTPTGWRWLVIMGWVLLALVLLVTARRLRIGRGRAGTRIAPDSVKPPATSSRHGQTVR